MSLTNTKAARLCVVCGADVVKARRRANDIVGDNDTCDPVCTRAKHAGRTREQQFWVDDEKEQQF